MSEQLTSTEAIQLEAIDLKVKQGALPFDLYVAAIDGKTIAKQLGVRRMRWHRPQMKADGFQRALDMNRIKEIAAYLGKNPILPNALVVAFEKGTIHFNAFPGQAAGHTEYGRVKIDGKPSKRNGELQPLSDNERIGYVIDGQHRLNAIEASTLA